jgi:putative membrane protein
MDAATVKEKRFNRGITVVSIVIPVVVALLFRVRIPNVEPLSFLPPIYATINGITAVLLIIAVWAIKNRKRLLHQRIMTTCIALSLVFLVMYVAYHMTSDSTPFGGEGTIKYIYYFILITHIILSIVIIPFVLITYVRGITNDRARHRKIAKITFPMWLYVAVTGVVVYLMISPYYI